MPWQNPGKYIIGGVVPERYGYKNEKKKPQNEYILYSCFTFNFVLCPVAADRGISYFIYTVEWIFTGL